MEEHSYEYWENYHNKLSDYIDYYKSILDKKDTIEMIKFNYNVEFCDEKVGSLYSELTRVKSIMSVLKYKYDSNEIQ
jgi:hypothetical protein